MGLGPGAKCLEPQLRDPGEYLCIISHTADAASRRWRRDARTGDCPSYSERLQTALGRRVCSQRRQAPTRARRYRQYRRCNWSHSNAARFVAELPLHVLTCAGHAAGQTLHQPPRLQLQDHVRLADLHDDHTQRTTLGADGETQQIQTQRPCHSRRQA